MHLARVVAAAGMIAAIAAPTATADGLPVLGIDDGSTGVTVPGGAFRYVTMPAGRSTIVAAIRRDGGQIAHLATWPGSFTIPAVAYDATAGGLSADRRTLVLIQPRVAFPRAHTRLLVLKAPSLRDATLVDLRGDFSFDAVSPDGSRLYLIQYTSAKDPTRYLVRSYDIRQWRLDPRPIVDPRDATEKMRGNPISRVTSAGGRFAYTLYDGGGSHPFIHALDTSDRAARCIDLDGLPPGIQLWDLRLRMGKGGGDVAVSYRGRPLLELDTQTFAVGAPAAGAHGSVWRVVGLSIACALLACLGVAFLLRVRSSRHPRAPEPTPVD